MAIADLGNPTDAQVSEYWRAYGEVVQARRAGYHKPYCNEHSDEPLWLAYDFGFHDALAKLAQRVPA